MYGTYVGMCAAGGFLWGAWNPRDGKHFPATIKGSNPHKLRPELSSASWMSHSYSGGWTIRATKDHLRSLLVQLKRRSWLIQVCILFST